MMDSVVARRGRTLGSAPGGPPPPLVRSGKWGSGSAFLRHPETDQPPAERATTNGSVVGREASKHADVRGRCAIVGGGIVGFVAFATLRHAGIAAEQIVVFDEDPDPAAAWLRRARAIRQSAMRSESDGHCAATSFPGLAVRAALRRRSLVPLAQSLTNSFHPTVDEFVEHLREQRERLAWDGRVVRARIGRIRAVDGGFELDGHGTFVHTFVATGHPGLALPPNLEGDPRVVHAYEPHDYAATVAVIGAGMAAATEWLNALAAGATVVSIRRREPTRRELNVPRQFFSRRGLAGFHATSPEVRAIALRELMAPSYPPGRAWDEPLERAAASGRFRLAPAVSQEEQVICATGFKRGFQHNLLLSRFVDEHDVDTFESWIVLNPDSTVPAVTDCTRTLSLAGVAAQWAFPAADTIVGAKYAAHGFLRAVSSCRTR